MNDEPKEGISFNILIVFFSFFCFISFGFFDLEEGHVSVEEDDFGMAEMEPAPLSRYGLSNSVEDSGPADRFEDGDSDENFVNTNIFVENLDDIDALANGAFTGARLFVNTSKRFPYLTCEKLYGLL